MVEFFQIYDREIFLAVIPARKGSKGISNKNMQLIGDKPMIQFTMEAALAASNVLIGKRTTEEITDYYGQKYENDEI